MAIAQNICFKYQKQGIVDVGNHDKEPRNSGSGERGKTYESGKMSESHVRWTYENGAGSAGQGCLCPGQRCRAGTRQTVHLDCQHGCCRGGRSGCPFAGSGIRTGNVKKI